MELDWGTVPDWLAAVGTVGALFFALFLFRHEVSSGRRKDADAFVSWLRTERSAQASGEWHESIRVFVSNSGSKPIPRAGFWVRARVDGKELVKFRPLASSGDTQGVSVQDVVNRGAGFNGPIDDFDAYLFFSDPQGRQWFRNIVTNKYVSERKGLKLRKKAVAIQGP